jgi:hypothetical protein
MGWAAAPLASRIIIEHCIDRLEGHQNPEHHVMAIGTITPPKTTAHNGSSNLSMTGTVLTGVVNPVILGGTPVCL